MIVGSPYSPSSTIVLLFRSAWDLFRAWPDADLVIVQGTVRMLVMMVVVMIG